MRDSAARHSEESSRLRVERIGRLARVARRERRERRGSALVLVLIMTLSLAGLAISAIYLTSSTGLLTRYYDKERDYRYAAEAALALGKSRVNKDTALGLPDDTAKTILSGSSLTDAAGSTISTIKVNLYAAYTGDTVGIYGQFVTLLSQAYDTGGTRHVRRLDLTAESFSRYAMFVDSFPSGVTYGTGEFIRGRAHSNTLWGSSGSPGPHYYDTVSAVTTISTSGTYDRGKIAGAARVPYPTVAKLSALPGYATTGNLNFTPVTGSAAAATNGAVNMSGRIDASNAVRGTRLSFRPVDWTNHGKLADSSYFNEQDGFMMLFDLASGMDTASLRAEMPRSGSTPVTNIVMLNQCGLLVTISNRREFFPVSRFRELWVRARVKGSTSPVISAADTATMGTGNAAAYNKILSYGPGFSRCFPAGSPYLMLSERLTNSSCALDSTNVAATTYYAWGSGASGGGCNSSKQYGGQDSTFTPNVSRCLISQAAPSPSTAGGNCTGSVRLGNWRAWGGTAVSGSPTSIQTSQKAYMWPLYKPYNLASKGVVHATAGPLFMSDTLRGNVTVYVLGRITVIDDLVYDQVPTNLNYVCRNFLGIIARDEIMLADAAMNRPRPDAGGTMRFLGPNMNYELHAVTMSLTNAVGIENYAGNTQAGATCQGNNMSGGCINQIGGVIHKWVPVTFSGTAGMRENRSVDPCQLTNRKPPFFPMTGRYVDNKYYEIDPVNVAAWTQVKSYYAKLRGRSAP